MSNELIERLRELSKRRCIGTYDEAADRIEELERECDKLREKVIIIRENLKTLEVALKVGSPEYGFIDWCDLVREALAATEPTSIPTDT